MDTNLKIKNDRPDGAGIRIQAWDGVPPTYDSADRRAKAALGAAKATDIDVLKDDTKSDEKDVIEKLPEGYSKMPKASLIVLLEERKKLGHPVEIDEADTVAILREKIEATYPEVVGDDEDKKEPEAKEKPKVSDADTTYNFKEGNMLQEITLSSNEEKTITVSSGHFLTIKIDE